MAKFNLMIARFPHGNQENPDCTDWLIRTVVEAKSDPRIGDVCHYRIDDTPITMGRNAALAVAQQAGVDYLLMVDSDMKPDLPGGKPFFTTSLDFVLQHNGPCVIAAPYCGPPPCCNVYIFRWANWMNDCPNPDFRLEQFTREEAAGRAGIEEVAALPTGVLLMDMRALDRLKPPYFYYEWEDARECKKASTEDVTFTRDLALAGVPQYVNWDSWAGHWKRYLVGKPAPLTSDQVKQTFKDAVLRNGHSQEKLVDVGCGVERKLPTAAAAAAALPQRAAGAEEGWERWSTANLDRAE